MLKATAATRPLRGAAYNASPGHVDAALKNAEKPVMVNASADPNAPKKINGRHAAAETQKYVARTWRGALRRRGRTAAPTFAEIDDRLRADPRLAATRRATRSPAKKAVRLFDEQTKAVKQREEDAVAVAMRGVIQNGAAGPTFSQRAGRHPRKRWTTFGAARKISKGRRHDQACGCTTKLTSNPATRPA